MASAVITAVLALMLLSEGEASAAQAPVGLGTAKSFAVLGGSTVTNTGPSVIGGDLGVSPGTKVTGFPPGKVSGTIHSADAVARQAKLDTKTAYNDAAGRAPTATITADLGGQTLVSGVYRGGALGLTGTLTLNAKGNKAAVFIFQASSTLTTATSSRVALINGAQPCNVFWQVGSSATLGTRTAFVGTILALTSVSANTRATVAGRLLARNGAVTLDSNTVTRSSCAAVTKPKPTSSSKPTSSPRPSSTATSGSTATPTRSATPASGGGRNTSSGGGSDSIPFTGAPVGSLVSTALLALMFGGILIRVGRPALSYAGRHRR